jgi:hypothetical protein
MQEPLIGNTLHHETDFVGVRNQEKTGSRAADASQDVVHPSSAHLLGEPGPAPLDPILDRVLVSGWPGQLAKLLNQLEHELDLPGGTIQRRHTPSIRRPSRNSNRGRLIAAAPLPAHPPLLAQNRLLTTFRIPEGHAPMRIRNRLILTIPAFADKKAYPQKNIFSSIALLEVAVSFRRRRNLVVS